MPDITTPPDPAELIDHEAVARANAARDATHAAHRAAQAAVADAEDAVKAANEVADLAVATGGDAMAAERAVADAEMTLRAAKRRLSAAAQAVTEAPYLHREAVGAAHAAAAREAVRQTLAAYRVAADAKAMIAAAERRVQDLQIELNTFFNVGARLPNMAVNRPGILREPEGEIRFWANSGFTFEETTQ